MEAGEVTVLNQDGVEWKSHLVNVKGRDQFYIRSCQDFFVANGIKYVGDPFTLEVIRGGTSPILKICSKVNTKSVTVLVLGFCYCEIVVLKRIVSR